VGEDKSRVKQRGRIDESGPVLDKVQRMRTQRNGKKGLHAAPVFAFCVVPLWRRQACRPLAHVFRQSRPRPTPDRGRPVSTGFQRGYNIYIYIYI
jgi:hypothetical protein